MFNKFCGSQSTYSRGAGLRIQHGGGSDEHLRLLSNACWEENSTVSLSEQIFVLLLPSELQLFVMKCNLFESLLELVISYISQSAFQETPNVPELVASAAGYL